FPWEAALWDLSDHYPVLGHFEFASPISSACQTYASEAVGSAKLVRDTYQCSPAIINGPRWSLNFDDHARWCMSAPPTVRQFEASERFRIMHECRLGRDPGNPTLQVALDGNTFAVSGVGFAVNAPVIVVLSGPAAQTPRIASAAGERIIAD